MQFHFHISLHRHRMYFHLIVLLLFRIIHFVYTDHYKGGTLSWKPVNPSLISGPTVDVIITERHSWTFTRYPCNMSTIRALGPYNDTQNMTAPGVFCISSSTSCLASLFQNITNPLYCTDYSTIFQISTGTYFTMQTLDSSSIIDIAWRGVSWANEVLTNSWSLVSHMDLTPINGKINTSPVSASLPIFQVYINQSSSIQILVGDADNDQIVRCRWANQLPLDECGDACLNLPNATLNSIDCIINWRPVLRPQDLASGANVSTYVIAIMVEDFANESSTTPLSSIPHQVLVYVTPRPAGTCPTKASMTSYSRRNMGCFAITSPSTLRLTFGATINGACLGDSIVDFISSSPLFLNKSSIVQVSNFTWNINIVWQAATNQTGLQPLCIAGIDNNGQISNQFCLMIMVGTTNMNLIQPKFVQGTASPVGTVMNTQSRFSIRANSPLRRSTLNITYIDIRQLENNSFVARIDVKNSPDVFFENNTLVFFFRNIKWIPGITYFVTMTQGVGTADLYCGLEDGGFGNNYTWRFTIWDSSLTSTLTPSTTTSTATTHTVTTRTMATTTPNLLFTTTGIPAYTTTTVTTTTSTTTTTVTTSTTTSATTTTTTTTTTTQYVPTLNVLYPKDLEQGCLQTITIITAVIAIVFIPLHFLVMINLISTVISNFKKQDLENRIAKRYGLRNDVNSDEEENKLL